jgi:hypothetical protein
MANGADNCCLLLTNHNPTHEPHCLPCNIISSSGPQINYFPSFQTLSAIRRTDSSAKFACASLQVVHRLPWSTESWTRSTQKNIPCTIVLALSFMCSLISMFHIMLIWLIAKTGCMHILRVWRICSGSVNNGVKPF